MTLNINKISVFFLVALFVFISTESFGQNETSKWKFQIAFGVNSPMGENDSEQFEFKGLNFPTIDLGIQHMFHEALGVRLDFGFNRSSNGDDSEEFKLNYTRINAQLVYDTHNLFAFMPSRMNIVGHIGPGISFTKPLSPYSDNTYTFLNALAGIEVHYGLSDAVSVYTDLSYALGLSDKNEYDPVSDGFSFNGDLLMVTVGLSVSLSGCYYCD